MSHPKNVTLIKFGGAVITNKEIPNQLRPEVLSRLVSELSRAWTSKHNYIVLGNGVGSFAHVPASRYETSKGFIREDSRIGMAITQDSAAQINRLVVQECLAQSIPAVTVAPSNSLVTRNGQAASYFTDAFEEYLRQDLLPVTHGDVLVDQTQGCTIWSTDTVFTFFAREFVARGWTVNKIIHVTEAAGVWKNSDKEVFSVITPSMREEVQACMVQTKGFDVTGGMWHKIDEALSLTELGIQTQIISGLTPDSLYKVLVEESKIGTLIKANK